MKNESKGIAKTFLQSGLENPSWNLVLLNSKTKKIVSTNLFACFKFGTVQYTKTAV